MERIEMSFSVHGRYDGLGVHRFIMDTVLKPIEFFWGDIPHTRTVIHGHILDSITPNTGIDLYWAEPCWPTGLNASGCVTDSITPHTLDVWANGTIKFTYDTICKHDAEVLPTNPTKYRCRKCGKYITANEAGFLNSKDWYGGPSKQPAYQPKYDTTKVLFIYLDSSFGSDMNTPFFTMWRYGYIVKEKGKMLYWSCANHICTLISSEGNIQMLDIKGFPMKKEYIIIQTIKL